MMKLFILFTFIFALASIVSFAQFSGGDGLSEETAFEIRTLQELMNVSLFPDKYFALKENIRDSLREPICSYTKNNPFTGNFNGNGFKITLAINNFYHKNDDYHLVAADHIGLFAYTLGATIRNVATDGYILSDSNWHRWTGGIVGMAKNTEIYNSTNLTNITSDFTCIGGIVGHLQGRGKVVNCVNNGNIYSTYGLDIYGALMGGIVGHLDCDRNGMNDTVKIINCINTGSLNGMVRGCRGGIVGRIDIDNLFNNNNSVIIIDNKNSGFITGSGLLGGIVGHVSVSYSEDVATKISRNVNTGVIILEDDDLGVFDWDFMNNHKGGIIGLFINWNE